MRIRAMIVTLLLAAFVTGTLALAGPTLAPGDVLTAAGGGRDTSCFDPNPGKGKSKGMWCDPPQCAPCEEVACDAGKCKFKCVPIPGCTP